MSPRRHSFCICPAIALEASCQVKPLKLYLLFLGLRLMLVWGMQESELLHHLDVLHRDPAPQLSPASSSSSGVRPPPVFSALAGSVMPFPTQLPVVPA